MCEHEPDEMIKTVDKNEDGKISYSEFRVKFSETIRIFFVHKIGGKISYSEVR